MSNETFPSDYRTLLIGSRTIPNAYRRRRRRRRMRRRRRSRRIKSENHSQRFGKYKRCKNSKMRLVSLSSY